MVINPFRRKGWEGGSRSSLRIAHILIKAVTIQCTLSMWHDLPSSMTTVTQSRLSQQIFTTPLASGGRMVTRSFWESTIMVMSEIEINSRFLCLSGYARGTSRAPRSTWLRKPMLTDIYPIDGIFASENIDISCGRLSCLRRYCRLRSSGHYGWTFVVVKFSGHGFHSTDSHAGRLEW